MFCMLQRYKCVWDEIANTQFVATVLVIQLMWACHVSWSSILTPRWRCSDTCSTVHDSSKRLRGGTSRWCFCRVVITMLLGVFFFFFWVKQHHVGRTPIRYFLKTWLQFLCWWQLHSFPQQLGISHQRTYHSQHQLTKYTTGDHLRKCWREDDPAQTLVERLDGQSPQKKSVQQQIIFVFFRWDMT